MKKLCSSLLLLFMFTSLSVKAQSKDFASLDAVLTNVNQALTEVSNFGSFRGDINVNIKFNSVVTIGKEGSVKIFFISIGGKKSRSEGKSVSYDFTISKNVGIKGDDKSLKTKLYNAIDLAMKGFDGVSSNNSLKNFSPDKVTVSLDFTLERSGSASGGYEFLPVTLSAGGTKSKKSVHTVTLIFNKE